jgi:hypothetical protein
MRVRVARDNCEHYRKQLPEHAAEPTKKRVSAKSDESGKSVAKLTPGEIAAVRPLLQAAETYLAQTLSAFETQFPEYLDMLNQGETKSPPERASEGVS